MTIQEAINWLEDVPQGTKILETDLEAIEALRNFAIEQTKEQPK